MFRKQLMCGEGSITVGQLQMFLRLQNVTHTLCYQSDYHCYILDIEGLKSV